MDIHMSSYDIDDISDVDEQTNAGLVRLLSAIRDETGFDFTRYKRGTLLRRISSRMRVCKAPTFDAYLSVMHGDPSEIKQLVSAMFINVTEFFRNPESFETIDKIVIPRVIHAKREHMHKRIKVWSCACSSGDEPYSLAMLFLEKLGNARGKFSISVHGTDIDADALKDARSMRYSREKLKALSGDLLQRYFEEQSDGTYILAPTVRAMVHFKTLDLIRDAPIMHCDIILCRNLLIYFNKALQEEILLKLYNSLMPGGFLVLGMVESLVGTAINHFEIVDNKRRIYRRPEWLTKDEENSQVLTQDEIDKIVAEMLG
jgi:chemotaxis protein methyltransferase CheR